MELDGGMRLIENTMYIKTTPPRAILTIKTTDNIDRVFRKPLCMMNIWNYFRNINLNFFVFFEKIPKGRKMFVNKIHASKPLPPGSEEAFRKRKKPLVVNKDII